MIGNCNQCMPQPIGPCGDEDCPNRIEDDEEVINDTDEMPTKGKRALMPIELL